MSKVKTEVYEIACKLADQSISREERERLLGDFYNLAFQSGYSSCLCHCAGSVTKTLETLNSKI